MREVDVRLNIRTLAKTLAIYIIQRLNDGHTASVIPLYRRLSTISSHESTLYRIGTIPTYSWQIDMIVLPGGQLK